MVSATEIPALSWANFLGEDRLLVICNDALLPSEIDWDGFAERDLIILESSGRYVNYLYKDKSEVPARVLLRSSKRFQEIVACSDASEFILIGKDTGVKKRWEDTLPIHDLFQTIDAMPMRQYEMRTRGRN